MTHTAHKKVTVQSRRPLPGIFSRERGLDGMTGKAARSRRSAQALSGLAPVVLSIGLPFSPACFPPPVRGCSGPGALPRCYMPSAWSCCLLRCFSPSGAPVLAAQAERAGRRLCHRRRRRGVDRTSSRVRREWLMLIGSTGRSFSSAGKEHLRMRLLLQGGADPAARSPGARGPRVQPGHPRRRITIEKIRQEIADSIDLPARAPGRGQDGQAEALSRHPAFQARDTERDCQSQTLPSRALNVGLMPEFVFRAPRVTAGSTCPWIDISFPGGRTRISRSTILTADELVYHDQVGRKCCGNPWAARLKGRAGRATYFPFRRCGGGIEESGESLIPSER